MSESMLIEYWETEAYSTDSIPGTLEDKKVPDITDPFEFAYWETAYE